MREHCLAQLTNALHENHRVSDTNAATDDNLEAVAVELEYGVFLTVKSVQVYKLTIHKKVWHHSNCILCVFLVV